MMFFFLLLSDIKCSRTNILNSYVDTSEKRLAELKNLVESLKQKQGELNDTMEDISENLQKCLTRTIETVGKVNATRKNSAASQEIQDLKALNKLSELVQNLKNEVKNKFFMIFFCSYS